jgi:hypothetical protein
MTLNASHTAQFPEKRPSSGTTNSMGSQENLSSFSDVNQSYFNPFEDSLNVETRTFSQLNDGDDLVPPGFRPNLGRKSVSPHSDHTSRDISQNGSLDVSRHNSDNDVFKRGSVIEDNNYEEAILKALTRPSSSLLITTMETFPQTSIQDEKANFPPPPPAESAVSPRSLRHKSSLPLNYPGSVPGSPLVSKSSDSAYLPFEVTVTENTSNLINGIHFPDGGVGPGCNITSSKLFYPTTITIFH